MLLGLGLGSDYWTGECLVSLGENRLDTSGILDRVVFLELSHWIGSESVILLETGQRQESLLSARVEIAGLDELASTIHLGRLQHHTASVLIIRLELLLLLEIRQVVSIDLEEGVPESVSDEVSERDDDL